MNRNGKKRSNGDRQGKWARAWESNDRIFNSGCDCEDYDCLNNLFQSTGILGGTKMSHDGNTRLLEGLMEEYIELGYSEEEAAKLAQEAYEAMD